MLTRLCRSAVWPVCYLVGVLLITGCASRRDTTRVHRSGGRMLHNITAEPEYNPPAKSEGIPQTPPAPRDADPPPPTRSTSDLPPAPPQDDFESAERPGRFSASFSPDMRRVTPASKSSDQTDESL